MPINSTIANSVKKTPRSHTKRVATRIVASFGAAMGTMYFTPSLDADVVNLSGNLPGTLNGTQQLVDFIGGTSFDWLQFNDASGRTITAAGYLNGIVQTTVGNILTAGAAFNNSLSLTASFSGTATFGIRTVNNQLGWLRVRYSPGNSTPIQYLSAAFETIQGNSIEVGNLGNAVPEPSTFGLAALGLLAFGAYNRRKRSDNLPKPE